MGYYLDAFLSACAACEVSATNFVAPLAVFGIVLVVLLLLYCCRHRLTRWAEQNMDSVQEKVDDTLELATVLVVTMQIIVLLQSNHLQLGGEELQNPYAQFLDVFEFLDLDVVRGVPTSCVVTASHFDFVVAWVFLPVVIFLVGCFGTSHATAEVRTRYLSYYVQGLFLVLPTISTTICEVSCGGSSCSCLVDLVGLVTCFWFGCCVGLMLRPSVAPASTMATTSTWQSTTTSTVTRRAIE